MDVTLTVIIPNYNNDKYLVQCIESVLVQSYQPKEIIIFDDCSTDHSREILQQYEKKCDMLRCIYSEINVGVSRARHTAIMEARTTYITVLDADDYYISKDKLLYEINTIKRCFSPEGRFVNAFSQVVRVDETGNLIDSVELKRLERNTRFKTVTRAYRVNVPRDFCFAKEAYMQAGGYASNCKLYEDWDLDLRLLGCSQFVFSKSLGTAYRQKRNGLSQVNHSLHYQAKRTIFRKNKSVTRYTIFEIVFFYTLLYLSLLRTKLICLIKRENYA